MELCVDSSNSEESSTKLRTPHHVELARVDSTLCYTHNTTKNVEVEKCPEELPFEHTFANPDSSGNAIVSYQSVETLLVPSSFTFKRLEAKFSYEKEDEWAERGVANGHWPSLWDGTYFYTIPQGPTKGDRKQTQSLQGCYTIRQEVYFKKINF